MHSITQILHAAIVSDKCYMQQVAQPTEKKKAACVGIEPKASAVARAVHIINMHIITCDEHMRLVRIIRIRKITKL